MANRSYLYTCDQEAPGQGFAARGVSQHAVAVPFVHKLLVTGAPRSAPSALWERGVAIVAAREGAFERAARFFALLAAGELPERARFEAAAAEMNDFLAAAPPSRFLRLEASELSSGTGIDPAEDAAELLDEVRALGARVERAFEGRESEWLERLRSRWPKEVEPVWWSDTLYYSFRPVDGPHWLGLAIYGVPRGREVAIREAVAEVLGEFGVLHLFESAVRGQGLIFSTGTEIGGGRAFFANAREPVNGAGGLAPRLEPRLRERVAAAGAGARAHFFAQQVVGKFNGVGCDDPDAAAFAIEVMNSTLCIGITRGSLRTDWRSYQTWEQRDVFSYLANESVRPEAFWQAALDCPTIDDSRSLVIFGDPRPKEWPWLSTNGYCLFHLLRRAACVVGGEPARASDLDGLPEHDLIEVVRHVRAGLGLSAALEAALRTAEGPTLDRIADFAPRVVAAEALAGVQGEFFELLALTGRSDMLAKAAALLLSTDAAGHSLVAVAEALPADAGLRSRCYAVALERITRSFSLGESPWQLLERLPLGELPSRVQSDALLALLDGGLGGNDLDAAIMALVYARRAATGTGARAERDLHEGERRLGSLPPDGPGAHVGVMAAAWANLAVAAKRAGDVESARAHFGRVEALYVTYEYLDPFAPLVAAVAEHGLWAELDRGGRIPASLVVAAARAGREQAIDWYGRVAHPAPGFVAAECAAVARDPRLRHHFEGEAARADPAVAARAYEEGMLNRSPEHVLPYFAALSAARNGSFAADELTRLARKTFLPDVSRVYPSGPRWLWPEVPEPAPERALGAAVAALGAGGTTRAQRRAVRVSVSEALRHVIASAVAGDRARASEYLDRLHEVAATSAGDPSRRRPPAPGRGLACPAWCDLYLTALAAGGRLDEARQVARSTASFGVEGAVTMLKEAFATRPAEAPALLDELLEGCVTIRQFCSIAGLALSRVEWRYLDEKLEGSRIDEQERMQRRLNEAVARPLGWFEA